MARSVRGARSGALLALALACPAQAGAAPTGNGQALAFATEKGNCLACHHIQGGTQMGDIGPPLADMRQRFPDRADLRARIHDARRYNPDTLMPPFGANGILTTDEIEHVIDFLYTR